MTTKTWKIGEYALGGVITVKINENTITVIGKDWDISQGTGRGSNQSKAKEFYRNEFIADSMNENWYSGGMPGWEYQLNLALQYLTTDYYAGKIVDWVKYKLEVE